MRDARGLPGYPARHLGIAETRSVLSEARLAGMSAYVLPHSALRSSQAGVGDGLENLTAARRGTLMSRRMMSPKRGLGDRKPSPGDQARPMQTGRDRRAGLGGAERREKLASARRSA